MKRHLFTILAISALTGCAGGAALQPPSIRSTAGPDRPTAIARFVIHVPQPAAGDLQAKYVSSGTRSVSIAMSGASSGTVNKDVTAGQSTYTIDVRAFAGSNTFTVNTYSAVGGSAGSGSVLSTGSASADLAANTSDQIPVTTLGVPASITLALATTRPTINEITQTIALTPTVKDAAGSTITGTFATPVTLTTSGTGTSRAPLTTTTLTSSSTTVNVTYNGSGAQGDAITYAASGITTTTSATLIPTGTLTANPLVVQILGTGSGGTVNATQTNGTLGLANNTCAGIATVLQTGTSGTASYAVTGTAVGSCSFNVTGSNSASRTVNVTVTTSSLTIS